MSEAAVRKYLQTASVDELDELLEIIKNRLKKSNKSLRKSDKRPKYGNHNISPETLSRMATVPRNKSADEYTDEELDIIFDGYAEWDGRTKEELDAELAQSVAELDDAIARNDFSGYISGEELDRRIKNILRK